jgi:hypothetical protein
MTEYAVFSRNTALRCFEYTFEPVSGLISGVNLKHRLPMQLHSGLLMNLYLSTVAGAASALVLDTSPTSRLTIGCNTKWTQKRSAIIVVKVW